MVDVRGKGGGGYRLKAKHTHDFIFKARFGRFGSFLKNSAIIGAIIVTLDYLGAAQFLFSRKRDTLYKNISIYIFMVEHILLDV